MGYNDDYTPLNFTLISGTLTAAYIDVSITDAAHPNIVGASSYITRYWTVDQSGISGSIDYDLSYIYKNGDIVGEEDSLVPAKWDGSTWTTGGSVATGTNTVSRNGITSFSDHTAMDDDDSPLPVELLNFTVEVNKEEEVFIQWSTASEQNNDYFTIERSKDGKDFEKLLDVKGSGTSSQLNTYQELDVNPYSGISYYRLSQTDYDGTREYFNTLAVQIKQATQKASLMVFPNPALGGENTTIIAKGYSPRQEVLIVVRDIQGKEHYSKVLIADESGNIVRVIDPQQKLSTGTYIIISSSDDQLIDKKLIVQ